MGHFVNLSSAIKTVLQGITDPTAAYVDIHESPTTVFTGYPAATIVPATTDSDYQTIAANLRTYAYYVDIFYPISDPSSSDGLDEAFNAMRGMMDVTLDALDNSDSLNNACQLLRPAPSIWDVVESGESVLLTARINLKCALTVQTNNG